MAFIFAALSLAFQLYAVNITTVNNLTTKVITNSARSIQPAGPVQFVDPPVFRFPYNYTSNNSTNTSATNSSLNATLNPFPAVDHDEQILETFPDNFSSMAYNVVAVAQYANYSYGPAYLLNGVTNAGYWYQVGLFYDWPNGGGANGFKFAYEVWDSSDDSIFPSGGGGGLANFSGPVSPGDNVLLSLNFSNGNVVMFAYDWDTGSSAQASYTAENAVRFVGLQSPSNGQGYFTGLMTEQYHVGSYNGTEQQVVYTVRSSNALPSAWLSMDEQGSDGWGLIGTQYTFSNSILFQTLTTHGAIEQADGYQLITGNYPFALDTANTLFTIAQGQSVLIDGVTSENGTSPYYYQWLAKAPGQDLFSSSEANDLCSDAQALTCTFPTTGSTSSGTYIFMLQVTDTPSKIQNAAVVNSSQITVNLNQAFAVAAPSPLSASIDSGQSITITDSGATGGISPYSYRWVSTSSMQNAYTFNTLIGSVLNGGIASNALIQTKSLQQSSAYSYPATNPYAIGLAPLPSPYGVTGAAPPMGAAPIQSQAGGIAFSSFRSGAFDNLLQLNSPQIIGLESNSGTYGESETLWLTGFPVFAQETNEPVIGTPSIAAFGVGGAYQARFDTPIPEPYVKSGNSINYAVIWLLGSNWTIINYTEPSSTTTSSNAVVGGSLLLEETLMPSVKMNITSGEPLNSINANGWNAYLLWTNGTSISGHANMLEGFVVVNQSPTTLLPGQSFSFVSSNMTAWKVTMAGQTAGQPDQVQFSSSVQPSISYQNFGTSANGNRVIGNLSKQPAQILNVQSQTQNAFVFAGQSSNSLAYDLTPYELNTPENSLVIGSTGTAVNVIISSLIGDGNIINPESPVTVTIAGYPSKNAPSLTSYPVTVYSLGGSSSASNTISITQGFYNITNIYLSSALPDISVNVVVGAVPGSTANTIAQLVSISPVLLYGQSGPTNYLAYLASSNEVTYNAMQPAVSGGFELSQASPGPQSRSEEYYTYSMQEYDVPGSTSSSDVLSFGIYNSTTGGAGSFNFQLNQSMTGIKDNMTYTSSQDGVVQAPVGFITERGSKVDQMSQSSVTVSLAKLVDYIQFNISEAANPCASSGGTSCSFSTTIPGTYSMRLQATDNSVIPEVANSSAATIIVSPTLSGNVVLSASGSTFDKNTDRSQDAAFSVNSLGFTGGTLPYTYNLLISSGGTVVYSTGPRSSLPSNLNFGQLGIGTGTFNANVIVSDSAISAESLESVNLVALSVNPAFTGVPTITPSANSVDIDHVIYFTANLLGVQGGSAPYSFNYIISNSVGVVYSHSYNSLNPSDNSINITSLDLSPGVYAANIVATDSASTPETVNSLPVDFKIRPRINETVIIPTNTILNVTFSNANTVLSLFNLANTLMANVIIANVTANFSSAPSASGEVFTKVVVLNVSVSANQISSINKTLTIGYNGNPSAAPYILNGTAWVEITPFTLNQGKRTIRFTIPGDPIVAVFYSTPVTTTVSSGSESGSVSGGGGGGAPPSGGGGNFKPTVLPVNEPTEVGWIIYNFTQKNQESVTINGTSFNIVNNFITPNSTGVSVNGKNYTLFLNKPANMYGNYYVQLVNISYLPILKTTTVSIFEVRTAPLAPTTNETKHNVTTTQSATTSLSTSVITTTAPPSTIQAAATGTNSSTFQYLLPVLAVLIAASALSYYLLKLRANDTAHAAERHANKDGGNGKSKQS